MVGAGYGRVKIVTPMTEAIRVIDELIARGQLSGTPPLQTYQNVANVVDREAENRSKHGAANYEEIRINDVAKELQSAGLANENFDASEIIRIYDILTHDLNGPTNTTNTVNTMSTAFNYELRNQPDLTTTLAFSNYSGDETVANPNSTDTSLLVGLRYQLNKDRTSVQGRNEKPAPVALLLTDNRLWQPQQPCSAQRCPIQA